MRKSVPLQIAGFATLAFTCLGCAEWAQGAAASGAVSSDKGFSASFVKTALPVQQLVPDTIPDCRGACSRALRPHFRL